MYVYICTPLAVTLLVANTLSTLSPACALWSALGLPAAQFAVVCTVLWYISRASFLSLQGALDSPSITITITMVCCCVHVPACAALHVASCSLPQEGVVLYVAEARAILIYGSVGDAMPLLMRVAEARA
jgi:hypothetical protein